jgi:hypothetical protein
LQKGLLTVPLPAPQWLASICLALLLPIVVEGNKWIRRRQAPSIAFSRRQPGRRSEVSHLEN